MGARRTALFGRRGWLPLVKNIKSSGKLEKDRIRLCRAQVRDGKDFLAEQWVGDVRP
jgi:hypothetical protein